MALEPQMETQNVPQQSRGMRMGGKQMQMQGEPQGQSQGIPMEEQIALAQQLLQQDPEAAQEVIQKLSQTGLTKIQIERLGILALWSIETPDEYPLIVETIYDMFPTTQQTLSGDLEQDGEMLGQAILAATAMEGGVI